MKLILAPRTHREIGADPIQLKPPLNKQPFEKQSLLATVLPSLCMSLPMLLGFYLMSRGDGGTKALYMRMGLITAVGSAFVGALMAAINLHRRNEKRRYGELLRKRSYRTYLQYLENIFSEHIKYTENVLRNEYPLFFELINITKDPQKGSVTVLNQNPSDKINIHLGRGDTDYVLPIKYDDTYQLVADILHEELRGLIDKYSCLKNVPVVLNMCDGDDLSVIASRQSDYYQIFIMLVARICLTYSPGIVKTAFCLSDRLYDRGVKILKFMPHITDPEKAKEQPEDVYLIIFTDDESFGRKMHEKKSRGQLKCKLILIYLGVDGAGNLIHAKADENFLVGKDGKRIKIQFDLISQRDFELLLKTCCQLRDFNETESKAIPTKVPILEILGKDGDNIEKNYQSDEALYNLSIPIGKGYNGSVVYLNLHEKGAQGDGPHGLIAGMTGSGKSELLMSMVLTMAVKFPPWYVSFFLIDYKGGGMAAGIKNLPHVIGNISNLSGSNIDRAFLSLRSENERRERLFLQYGVSNILGYQEKYRDGQCSEPLPHIFIIIDEFAQLKLEEPDFMRDLIALSRVGRSLGMHLILGTQKPSGSVDGQIISNMGFMIALKLQDAMDSKEVIGRSDAAYLTNPGRAILRCGNDERIETFQAAYSLSPVISPKRKEVVTADYYGNPLEKLYYPPSGENSLEYLVRKITVASGKMNVTLRKMWLSELPKEVSMQEVLTKWKEMSKAENGKKNMIPVGLWDDPVIVKSGIFCIGLNSGNTLICGMPYSGKSTLIMTFLKALMGINGCVGIYIFDWGGGQLFETFCADKNMICFTEGDMERVKTLIDDVLHEKNDERKIMVFDGIGSFFEEGGYAVSSMFKELLRKSEAGNVKVIVSTLGLYGTEISKNLQGYFKEIIALRQQDLYHLSEILSEPHFRGRTDLCPGRGYGYADGRIVEFMTGRFEDD